MKKTFKETVVSSFFQSAFSFVPWSWATLVPEAVMTTGTASSAACSSSVSKNLAEKSLELV